MRRLLLPALGTAALLLLSGCTSGPDADADGAFTDDATGELKAWGFDNADEVGTSRLDYAEGQLSDVEITIDQTAFDAQKFTTRAASGVIPDVVQMDRNFVATYAAQGLITPLDQCFAVHDVDPAERYYPSVVDDITYDDHVWAVPQFYQPPAIMLNTRVMAAAGVTADQIDTSKPDALLAAVTKLYQANGNTPALLGLDPVAPSQAGLWLLGMGGQVIGDDGEPTLDDESNRVAVDFLKQLLDAQGGYAKVKSFTDSFDTFGDGNQFVTDQVAAQVDAQWYVNVLTPYVDQVQISAVPFRGPDGQPFTVASGTSFVIPSAAKNRDAACAWALALTSQDAWLAAGDARAATIDETPGAINTGLFTGSPEADQAIRDAHVVPSGNTGFDEAIATFYDVVPNGTSLGASPAGQQIQTELQNALASVFLGDKTTEQALADAQAAAMRAYEAAKD
ncbi:ABC transporter substrate-binding protein [Plantibacter sp. MPB07]|uniref:ABC transporter substrate-binding protein n=1 Tax=Plantibacter sp. MPB07 TaxID=3388853 RepID=UPI0039882D52